MTEPPWWVPSYASANTGAAVLWQVNYSTGTVTTTQLTPAAGINAATGVSGQWRRRGRGCE